MLGYDVLVWANSMPDDAPMIMADGFTIEWSNKLHLTIEKRIDISNWGGYNLGRVGDLR
jgi:hypothetical protein